MFTLIPVKIGEKTKAKGIFRTNFRVKWKHFVLFQSYPRKQIDSLFKEQNVDITSSILLNKFVHTLRILCDCPFKVGADTKIAP
jgi:hypothetical protein